MHFIVTLCFFSAGEQGILRLSAKSLPDISALGKSNGMFMSLFIFKVPTILMVNYEYNGVAFCIRSQRRWVVVGLQLQQ